MTATLPSKHGAWARAASGWRAMWRVGAVLLLSACGGGLGGSGDGGNDTSLIVPLPDGFDAPYEFRHVPTRLIATFPASLARGDDPSPGNSNSPYDRLTESVVQLLDHKLEIGLLQLHVDANWDALTTHCAATPDDSPCNLEAAGIATAYTAAMASREYLIRAAAALEQSGADALSDDALGEIATTVSDRIGTPLAIDSGTFTRRSASSYRYEIVTTLDIGFGPTIYTLRWSDDRTLTFLSIAVLEEAGLQTLQSSTSRNPAANGYSNAILVTTLGDQLRQERQLNLSQRDGSRELGIESQLTEILGNTKYDYYSRGNAGSDGGFLGSETSSVDASDVRVSEFVRESFTADAMLESRAVCQNSSSLSDCDSGGQWVLETAGDPILSQFFLTPDELDELESRLLPFDVRFSGVSTDLDTLILIRRENLTISVSSEGIILTIPGLGTLDFTGSGNSDTTGTDDIDTANPEPFSQYADSVLCRANKAVVDGEIAWRSFCAGSVEEIENALVVGETFREGRLVIEWQANATIEVRSSD